MKKLIIVAMVAAFALSSAGLVMAKAINCTVDSVDGDKVTMTCDGADVKAGDKVKVKAGGKKAVEGC